jgi:hypothetical protein
MNTHKSAVLTLLAAILGLYLSDLGALSVFASGAYHNATASVTRISATNSYLVSDEKSQPAEHCIASEGESVQCFATVAESLKVASGGRIQLAPGQTASSLSYDELFAPDSLVLAILYEHANYGGATLTIYGDNCGIWNNMPGGWNDVTSSVQTSSCGISLYVNANLGGTGLWVAYPGTSYVGDAMNDKASSWNIP